MTGDARSQPTAAEAVLKQLIIEGDKLPVHRAATESEALAHARRCAPLWEIARAIVGRSTP